MGNAMDELVARFKSEARERHARIARLADAGDGVDAIREEAHKIKGAAGMLGFPELKERAAELELLAASGEADPSELAATIDALAASLPD